MVVPTKIQCDACDTSFYIKYQIDQMISMYPWNLDFYCPLCGNRIHVILTSKGLNCKHSDEEGDDEAYLIGYSSCLPITKELYFPLTNRDSRMLSLTPFINLTRYYGNGVIPTHTAFIKRILDNVFEYRNSLTELLPILKKPNMNPEAYTRKNEKVFNIKASKYRLRTYTECVDHYAEMVRVCYINVAPPTIRRAPYGDFFIRLMDLVQRMKTADTIALKNELNQYFSLNDWLIKNAFNHIAGMIGKIEKYSPVMFYGVTGEYSYPHSIQLFLVTINYKEVNNDYRKGYEVLEKILPAVVALENRLNRGDVNNFGEGLKYTMSDFIKHTAGTKVGIIQKNEMLRNYFLGTLKNTIRNSETHDDSDFDSENQICRFVDLNNTNNITEIPLMDVAFKAYIQLIHIMEISLVVNSILQRAWT